VKLFRKFFIENSGYFFPQVEFIEVSGLLTLHKLNLKEEGVIHHFVNKMDGITTKGEEHSYYNLKFSVNRNTKNSDKGNI